MSEWKEVRLASLLREVDDRGHPDLEVLSVYRDLGVVPKASRDDNFNKTPENLSLYKRVRRGDLVINKMKAWSGSMALSDYDGIVSGDYMVCAVVRDVDRRFLHHLLRSKAVFSEIAARSTGIRPNQWRLYWEDLRDVRVRLPSVSVQAEIGRHLDAQLQQFDVLAGMREKQLVLLDERVVAAVRPMLMTAPGPVRPISALARYINGYPFKPDDFTESGLPVVRIRQLVDPDADVDRFDGPVPSGCLLDSGDLVFSWSANLEVRIWDRGPAILNQHLFRVVPAESVDLRWLRWVLHIVRDDFVELMHGSTMIHITQPMMKEVRVPVPDLATQQVTARRADGIERSTSLLRGAIHQQVELLRERRQALITAAVTGRLEIPGVAA